MSKANPKDGTAFSHGSSYPHDGFLTHRGVSRTVGDHDAVEVFVKEVVIPGDFEYRGIPLQETADDALLTAAVNEHHLFVPAMIAYGLLHADQGQQVIFVRIVEVLVRLREGDFPQQGPFYSQALRQHSG